MRIYCDACGERPPADITWTSRPGYVQAGGRRLSAWPAVEGLPGEGWLMLTTGVDARYFCPVHAQEFAIIPFR